MKSISYYIKRLFSNALYSSGYIDNILKKMSFDDFLILMYHRVLPSDKAYSWIQSGMYTQPKTLDMHLRFLKDYFHIIPISDINKLNTNKQKPLIILTFDDGWKDFYNYAFPILNYHAVPSTVFLPTGFIGTNKLFWTDRLSYILYYLHNQRLFFDSKEPYINDPIIYSITKTRGTFSSKLERSISILKQYSSEYVENLIQNLELSMGLHNQNNRSFMSWEEVRTLKNSGLVSFGSHSVNHKILTNNISNEQLDWEITASKSQLVKHGAVNINEPIPFCYPNGNYNLYIKEKVREIYGLACTTKSGVNKFDDDQLTLKRIPVHEDMSHSKGLFGSKLIGLL